MDVHAPQNGIAIGYATHGHMGAQHWGAHLGRRFLFLWGQPCLLAGALACLFIEAEQSIRVLQSFSSRPPQVPLNLSVGHTDSFSSLSVAAGAISSSLQCRMELGPTDGALRKPDGFDFSMPGAPRKAPTWDPCVQLRHWSPLKFHGQLGDKFGSPAPQLEDMPGVWCPWPPELGMVDRLRGWMSIIFWIGGSKS